MYNSRGVIVLYRCETFHLLPNASVQEGAETIVPQMQPEDKKCASAERGVVACWHNGERRIESSVILNTWQVIWNVVNYWTSNGSWCMGIKGEMSGTVCVTFTWYMYIYELFIAFVCFVVCSLLYRHSLWYYINLVNLNLNPLPMTPRTTTPWQRSKFRYLDRSQSNKDAINMNTDHFGK